MNRRPTLLSMLALFSLVFLQTRRAEASLFQVSPVRLNLSAQTTNGLLSVQNQSNEPLRFQVVAYEWRQAPDGEMLLLPTSEVAVFPSMVVIPAGASRKVRVGVLGQAGASEKSYRVFVEELPPSTATRDRGVKVLTRMGIPVFLAALAPSSKPAVEGLALRAGRLTFSLKNEGNTHFMTQQIRVLARNDSGQLIQENKLKGWYVLGSDSRRHDLVLPTTSCAGLASLTIEVETDRGTTSATLGATAAACLR